MLERNSGHYRRIRNNRIMLKAFQGLREQCMGAIWVRMKTELQELRDLKAEHEKKIENMNRELQTTRDLLDSFKAKNAEAVAKAQKQLAKI